MRRTSKPSRSDIKTSHFHFIYINPDVDDEPFTSMLDKYGFFPRYRTMGVDDRTRHRVGLYRFSRRVYREVRHIIYDGHRDKSIHANGKRYYKQLQTHWRQMQRSMDTMDRVMARNHNWRPFLPAARKFYDALESIKTLTDEDNHVQSEPPAQHHCP